MAIGAARWTRFAALAQTEFALQHRSPARALMLGVHLGLAASDPSVPRATCAAATGTTTAPAACAGRCDVIKAAAASCTACCSDRVRGRCPYRARSAASAAATV